MGANEDRIGRASESGGPSRSASTLPLESYSLQRVGAALDRLEMAIARAPPHSAERYHYARLLLSVSVWTPSSPWIDHPTDGTLPCPLSTGPAESISTPISANTGAAQPSGTETATVIDRATVLQLFSRLLQDLYGTMGGPVALGEIDVVAIEPARGRGQEQDDKASEVVIRFPAG